LHKYSEEEQKYDCSNIQNQNIFSMRRKARRWDKEEWVLAESNIVFL
jgi:hypothetical protein